jgi:hypothetical protein
VAKYKGGLYVFRVDKPHALIGLPLLGRHFGYGGMTNSYYFREKQHLEGSTKYDTVAQSWSDLRPKCYRILPLPAWLLHSRNKWRRRFVRFLETIMIGVLCPVYNDTQQAPWNIRKISKVKARAQRAARDELGMWAKVGKAVLRWLLWLGVLALALGVALVVAVNG